MAAPADGRQPAETVGGTLPSPLDSVDDMRTAAKWTLAAAGAVGAALISGGPLLAVGQVHGFWHTVLAWLGLVIALFGVGLAIWHTSQVLMPRLTTPSTVRKADELKPLLAAIDAEPAQFMGLSAESVAELFDRQLKVREEVFQRAFDVSRAPNDKDRAPLLAELARAQRRSQVVDSYVRSMLTLCHAWLIRADLKRSRKWTLVGGVIVAFGAVMFLSVTGSSGPSYVPVVTTSPTATSAVSP